MRHLLGDLKRELHKACYVTRLIPWGLVDEFAECTFLDGVTVILAIGDEAVDNIYKGAVILQSTFDFSTVEIIPESELPEGAEILGGNNNAEIM